MKIKNIKTKQIIEVENKEQIKRLLRYPDLFVEEDILNPQRDNKDKKDDEKKEDVLNLNENKDKDDADLEEDILNPKNTKKK